MIRILMFLLPLLLALPLLGPGLQAAAAVPGQLAGGWQELARQTTRNTCGHAVISTVLWRLEQPVTELQLAARMRPGSDGLTLAELAQLAAEAGMSGTWFRIPLTALPHGPFIAHLNLDGGHYVLVDAVSPAGVLVNDPARGRSFISRHLFARLYGGRAFLPGHAG